MKLLIKVLILLISISQINSVTASENISGTWQGELLTSPSNELTIQFIIEQNNDGSYPAILNTPDHNIINKIKATSVSYDLEMLKIVVDEMSGSYEGIVKDRKIEGEWKQSLRYKKAFINE